MKERPILFSAPMVRALLAGTKTQTRRALRPQPPEEVLDFCTYHNPRGDGLAHFGWDAEAKELQSWFAVCPYGQVGDQLWVRETLKPWTQDPDLFAYAADDTRVQGDGYNYPVKPGRPYVPSIHMARCWSRITMEVTDVRVERLQDISEADCIAEGCKADEPETWWQGYKDCGGSMGWIHQQAVGDAPPDWMLEPHKMAPTPHLERSAKWHYERLWKAINGAESWAANPYVWAVSFKPIPNGGA